jgi:hypothetical protein
MQLKLTKTFLYVLVTTAMPQTDLSQNSCLSRGIYHYEYDIPLLAWMTLYVCLIIGGEHEFIYPFETSQV